MSSTIPSASSEYGFNFFKNVGMDDMCENNDHVGSINRNDQYAVFREAFFSSWLFTSQSFNVKKDSNKC